MVNSPKDKTTGTQDALTAARAKAQNKPGKDVSRETSEHKEGYRNIVDFSGRLGKDVEYKMTDSGKELAKSSLGVFNPGDKANKTMWFELVMWLQEEDTDKGPANRPLFEEFLNMSTGAVVHSAKGRLTMWVPENGVPRYTITLTDIG